MSALSLNLPRLFKGFTTPFINVRKNRLFTNNNFNRIINNKWTIYSLIFGSGSFLSYNLLNNGSIVRASMYIDMNDDDEIDNHFHLLDSLQDIQQKISPQAMLKIFQTMVQDLGDEQKITLSLLNELFAMVGVSDDVITANLFKVMDWDGSGTLEPSEVAAVMTLFQQGSSTDRYKFLFECLDLDGNGEVDKMEFRKLLTALLEAHYKLSGLTDPFVPEEIFTDVELSEYHTVAKWRANRLVLDIFNYADVNRDGVLSLKEFLKWCRRGGKEVDMLRDILTETFSGLN